jgi:hypothetical protein
LIFHLSVSLTAYIRTASAFVGADSESEFVPIPDFNRSDADVSFIFLNRALLYTDPVTDPWFNATFPLEVDGWSGEKWMSPLATTAIACTEQYQFCNGYRCTPISGLYAMNDKLITTVGFNPHQMATFRLLWNSTWAIQMRYLLINLGTNVLLAKDQVYTSLNPLSQTLPPNQWHIEMENIHNISMAMLQRRVIDHALPSNLNTSRSIHADTYIIPENDAESLRLCSHQRIKTSEYSSFSVLGLALIISGCSLTILISILLPRTMGWFQRKTGRGLHRRLEWIESQTLQLQRMLFEKWGIGPWKGGQNAVPVTAMFGQKFQPGNSLSTPGTSPHTGEVSDPLLAPICRNDGGRTYIPQPDLSVMNLSSHETKK